MPPDSSTLPELDGAIRLGVATLIGLGVGLERQWSGHASGPDARFAGLRTFTMLGVLGGTAGLLSILGHGLLAAVALAAGLSISVAAYVAASRRPTSDLDGTTEVAAAVVLCLGALAGAGWLMVASAAGAVMVLALSEKQRLHRIVGAIEERELHAGLQFFVLAVVVLPVLPRGPYLGALAVRPRALWGVVLAFCALNFASYVARRLIGSRRGYGVAGALGGLLSSTAVTLGYARRSRVAGENGDALARGVIAACTVLIPRILVVSATLEPRVALAALPYLAPSMIAGVLLVFSVRGDETAAGEPPADGHSPLRLMNALQMALAFQVALSAIALLGAALGKAGIFGAAVVLGLTDMDALTVAMSRPGAVSAAVAGKALGVGMLANTAFKLTLSLTLGSTAFRRRAATGLAALAALTGVALILL